MSTPASWEEIISDLVAATRSMTFSPPIRYVYHPLTYAGQVHLQYCRTYGRSARAIMLLGINPGPWGMAQTGVPFGDRDMVRDWLGLQGPVQKPAVEHPKRPIQGFACRRPEVSGQRLWGWAKARFHTPQRFFERFWVANYCPLVFMEAGGRNVTPDKLKRSEQADLFAACDQALVQTVERLKPNFVVGVGRFAAQQARRALSSRGPTIGYITHPSPANPAANRGWAETIESQLADMGIKLGA